MSKKKPIPNPAQTQTLTLADITIYDDSGKLSIAGEKLALLLLVYGGNDLQGLSELCWALSGASDSDGGDMSFDWTAGASWPLLWMPSRVACWPLARIRSRSPARSLSG